MSFFGQYHTALLFNADPERFFDQVMQQATSIGKGAFPRDEAVPIISCPCARLVSEDPLRQQPSLSHGVSREIQH